MLAFTLNPGFVPIIVGLLTLAAPRVARAPMMAGAALLALWLLLDYEFGAAAAMAQMGLPVVLLSLDALNRIFGIAMIIALIALSLYSSGRRSRYEDAAILVMAGGAISALFVGDLISFVAAAALSGLAAAWTVLASPLPRADRAGARLLIWHGLEGLLFLVGVALHLAGSGKSVIERLDVTQVGDACIFGALMIRVGAPLAHVWFKDVVSHASPTGAAALSSFTTMLGVYALARLFPAEPLLLPIGAAMAVIGAFYAAADDDLRRAGAYALTAQCGVCLALIGVGSPLALAAAEGHAFTALLAFAGLQLIFGNLIDRLGVARVSRLQGASRLMPVTSFLMLVAGFAAAGVPGFALFATQTVALEAMAQWELRAVWTIVAALPAIVFVSLALRPGLAAYRASAPAPRNETNFTMLLGAGLLLFLCVSVGIAPRWLYDLMPATLTFQPYALDRLAPQLALFGVAGVAYALLQLTERAAKDAPDRLLDMDSLYRGPIAAAGRWAGVVLLRLYGAWQSMTARIARAGGTAAALGAEACDRPFNARNWAQVAQFVSVAAVLVLMLLFS